MNITVLGAGSIGAAIVRELCTRSPQVDQVQVCDTRSRALQSLHADIDSRALRSFQVDVRDIGVLSQVLRNSDCAISCVPPELNPGLAELCIEVGTHFCDLGGNDAIVQQQLALAERAREKSLWVVPNCGLAPGLVNILCLHGIDQFDDVEAVSLRVGDVPLYPEDPFNFRISWSAERILDDYTHPAQHIRNGTLVSADPLSGTESIHFDAEPFDTMEAFYTQGGLSTLAETLVDRVDTFDHKTIRWPGHAHQMRFVIGLGLGDARKIGVRTHLTYRDILVRRMRERLGGDYADAVLLRVLLRGTVDGAPKSLVYEMVERYDEASGETAMMRATAIPAVATALLVAQNGQVAGGGANVPEHVVPRPAFLEATADRGLCIDTEWHNGPMEVTSLRALHDA